MTSILSAVSVCLLNTLTAHTLLIRKKPIIYCIVTFIINTLVLFFATFLVQKNIQNQIIVKYLIHFIGFMYIGYIHLIFKESISKKIFTMCSIWVFSTIALFLAVPVAEAFSSIVGAKYIQNFIYILRICIQILFLLASYFWLRNPYRKVIGIVPGKTIKFMSLYLAIAFLLLINNYPTELLHFRNFNSIYDMVLFLVFITLGYLIVFGGIYSSSKTILLQCKIINIENKVKLHYHAANFDNLTGIANRANIMKNLDRIIENSNTSPQRLALMVLDLDKFKIINDKYGHLIGDKALKYAAQKVEKVLTNTDFFGRFGGDEFVIIQQFIKDERDVEILINRIFEELKNPMIIGDDEILIEVSVGVSIFPEDDSDSELLINKADKAMYEAKGRAGCTFSFFENSKLGKEYDFKDVLLKGQHIVVEDEVRTFVEQSFDGIDTEV